MELCGIDFTSAPSRRKPITIAIGQAGPDSVHLQRVLALESLTSFEQWLGRQGPWLGVFDLPFGLPRAFVIEQGWPLRWTAIIEQLDRLSKAELRMLFKAYCDARPAGQKFAHRATDRLAGSSPSMKWVNPPVAWMLKAAVPRLLRAEVDLPGLRHLSSTRIALEGYPGMLARSVTRASYKSDDRRRQNADRAQARERILLALVAGECQPAARVTMTKSLRSELLADASGDRLDAALCLAQAQWAWQRRNTGFGLPNSMDAIEGWILGAVPHKVGGAD